MKNVTQCARLFWIYRSSHKRPKMFARYRIVNGQFTCVANGIFQLLDICYFRIVPGTERDLKGMKMLVFVFVKEINQRIGFIRGTINWIYSRDNKGSSSQCLSLPPRRPRRDLTLTGYPCTLPIASSDEPCSLHPFLQHLHCIEKELLPFWSSTNACRQHI
jgi:hypothetical protein